MFCSCCGRKLRLEWRLDRVILDDYFAPPAAPVYTPPVPEPPAKVEEDGRFPAGYLKVVINLPRGCIPLKGSFSYYSVRWDGKDMGTCQMGGSITIRTLARTHQLILRQVNNRVVGNEVKEQSFQVPINGNRTLTVTATQTGFDVE